MKVVLLGGCETEICRGHPAGGDLSEYFATAVLAS